MTKTKSDIVREWFESHNQQLAECCNGLAYGDEDRSAELLVWAWRIAMSNFADAVEVGGDDWQATLLHFVCGELSRFPRYRYSEWSMSMAKNDCLTWRDEAAQLDGMEDYRRHRDRIDEYDLVDALEKIEGLPGRIGALLVTGQSIADAAEQCGVSRSGAYLAVDTLRKVCLGIFQGREMCRRVVS